MKLSDNTILITGGTAGIGLELGKTLLQLNNKVILLGRNQKKLQDLKKEGFETIECDMSDRTAIENASIHIQNEYPDLNMLFNNAGVQYNYDFLENVIPLEKIDQEVRINITGQILMTQLLIPILSQNKGAFIINTTSGLGAFPKSDGLVYSATKAAMRNFTTGLRYALKDQGIKVLEFIPPVTDTAMTAGRNEGIMPVHKLIDNIIPQLKKEKTLITVGQIRFFLFLSYWFPGLAAKILNK